jgi:hypothetical protein
LDCSVQAWAEDGELVGVSPLDYETHVCGEPDDSKKWYFVIFGKERGETPVNFRVGEDEVASVPVVVW